MTWVAPDVERPGDSPARRNEPEREMLRDWLDWHRAPLLRACEEYARHNGHADLIREAIDGSTGA